MTSKGILQKSTLMLVKEYLLITFGVTLYALGWAVFLGPNNMIGGGVTGFSAILESPGADILSDRLMDALGGLSPLVCREVSYRACGRVCSLRP